MLAVKIKNLVGMTNEKYGHVVTGFDIPDLSNLLKKAHLIPTASSTYSKFFTEMLELCINFAYVMLLSRKSDVKIAQGTIAPGTKEQIKAVGNMSLLRPVPKSLALAFSTSFDFLGVLMYLTAVEGLRTFIT